MKWILTMKHWQIFLLLLPFTIMGSIEVYENMGNLYLIRLAGIIVIFLWSFLLTNELIKIVPERYTLNTNLYYINAIIFFNTIVLGAIIYGEQGVEFTGIYGFIGFYIFYAYLQSFGFAGRIIRSMELNRKSKRHESIGYFFLFVFIPIGIWFLQPKINRLSKEFT